MKSDTPIHLHSLSDLPSTLSLKWVENPQNGSVLKRPTQFHRNYFLALMSYAISWLHPKMQIKDSDFKVTRAFNNCNIVDLATQKYLKSTNLLINHHYTSMRTSKEPSRPFSGQTSNHPYIFQTLNFKRWFINICTHCSQLIKAHFNHSLIHLSF